MLRPNTTPAPPAAMLSATISNIASSSGSFGPPAIRTGAGVPATMRANPSREPG